MSTLKESIPAMKRNTAYWRQRAESAERRLKSVRGQNTRLRKKLMKQQVNVQVIEPNIKKYISEMIVNPPQFRWNADLGRFEPAPKQKISRTTKP